MTRVNIKTDNPNWLSFSRNVQEQIKILGKWEKKYLKNEYYLCIHQWAHLTREMNFFFLKCLYFSQQYRTNKISTIRLIWIDEPTSHRSTFTYDYNSSNNSIKFMFVMFSCQPFWFAAWWRHTFMQLQRATVLSSGEIYTIEYEFYKSHWISRLNLTVH